MTMEAFGLTITPFCRTPGSLRVAFGLRRPLREAGADVTAGEACETSTAFEAALVSVFGCAAGVLVFMLR